MVTSQVNRRSLVHGIAAAGLSAVVVGAHAGQRVAAQSTPLAQGGGAGCDPLALLPRVPAFSVTSVDVQNGVQLPQAQMSGIFGAGGQDRSPQLAWSGFPATTKSFCVTMYDPDAETGSGFWHWAVVDIPGTVAALAADAGAKGGANLPSGAFPLPNDARLAQYVGAAPPKGDPPHRYYIVVTALDAPTIGVAKDATPALLGFMMGPHSVGRAVLVPVAQTGA
ncbi:MAG TPA: YbhB/YbcL family Raf kinase inhibitor-like protein [Thermomicrobiales bacterium]|nr:YbhB/YbcL family Raf kinase inhibitor-like protein [Thermomicrobiales bacterium]